MFKIFIKSDRTKHPKSYLCQTGLFSVGPSHINNPSLHDPQQPATPFVFEGGGDILWPTCVCVCVLGFRLYWYIRIGYRQRWLEGGTTRLKATTTLAHITTYYTRIWLSDKVSKPVTERSLRFYRQCQVWHEMEIDFKPGILFHSELFVIKPCSKHLELSVLHNFAEIAKFQVAEQFFYT